MVVSESLAVSSAVQNAMSKILKATDKVVQTTKKIFNAIERSSPALQQQLIIFRKSIMLVLRPIGDILAKFLRPMALWMIKFAMKWYQLFGGGGQAGNDTRNEKEDLIESLKDEKKSAEAMGDTERAEDIQEKINELNAELGNTFSKMTLGVSDFGTAWDDFIKTSMFPGFELLSKENDELWKNLIPEEFNSVMESLKNIWDDMVVIAGTLYEAVKPVIDVFMELAEGVLGKTLLAILEDVDKKLNRVELSFDLLAKVVEAGRVVFTDLWNKMKPFNTWIKDTFTKVWTDLKTALKGFGDWIKSKFKWLSNLGRSKKNLFGDKAVGGLISETGDYTLHAGERVVPAGKVGQTESRTIMITNNFNISASVSSEMDIKQLARRLADHQEIELRRRVSYV